MARSRVGRRVDYNWGNTMARINVSVQSAGTATIGQTALLFAQAQTIMRVRGAVVLGIGAAAAATDAMIICLGLIVVSENAFGAGAASVPSPFEDIGDDWLWHGVFPLRAFSASPTGIQLVGSMQREIDSKAMRRVKEGDVLTFVADGIDLDAGATYSLSAGIRILTGA